MSASDAAPLPRLGEVFFDVRGSSRSMRLSWYSDTGVAVFSIWQGGTCTGTFRLPIEDLSRMVEALQRGPRGAGLPVGDAATATGGHPALGGEASVTPFPEYATGQHMAPVTGEFRRPDLGDHDAPAFIPAPAASAASYPEPAFRDAPRDPLAAGGYRSPSPVPSFTPTTSQPASSYREDPLTSPSYRDQGRSSFAHRDSGEHHWSDDPRGSGSYPLPGYSPAPVAPAPSPPAPSYRDDPLDGGSYRDDPLTSPNYRDQGRSAAPYQGDRRWGDGPLGSGSYPQPSFTPHGNPAARGNPAPPDYPNGYRDDDPPVYPPRQGDAPSGYGGQRYPDDPFQSNYPDEARGGSHPYGPGDSEPRGHRGRPSRT
jgi:hypothetical protein